MYRSSQYLCLWVNVIHPNHLLIFSSYRQGRHIWFEDSISLMHLFFSARICLWCGCCFHSAARTVQTLPVKISGTNSASSKTPCKHRAFEKRSSYLVFLAGVIAGHDVLLMTRLIHVWRKSLGIVSGCSL